MKLTSLVRSVVDPSKFVMINIMSRYCNAEGDLFGSDVNGSTNLGATLTDLRVIGTTPCKRIEETMTQKTLIISRHPATQVWLKQDFPDAVVEDHLTEDLLAKIDGHTRVIGNLPAPLVAKVTEQGARYDHVTFPARQNNEITDVDQLRQTATLTPVRAWLPGSVPKMSMDEALPPPAPIQQGWLFVRLFAALTVVGLSISALYDLLVAFMKATTPEDRMVFAFGAIVTFACATALAGWLWTLRHRIVSLSIRRTPRTGPRRGIIMGLSSVGKLADETISAADWINEMVAIGLPQMALPKDAFSEALNQNPDWKIALIGWQQQLRLIYENRSRLDTVVVVGSIGESGSGGQLAIFKELVERLCAESGHAITVLGCPAGPVDFEDHDTLRDALQGSIGLLSGRGIPPRDIVVDVTGATKIYTIAAAALTINHDAVFSYVTNAGTVRYFDAVAALGEIE